MEGITGYQGVPYNFHRAHLFKKYPYYIPAMHLDTQHRKLAINWVRSRFGPHEWIVFDNNYMFQTQEMLTEFKLVWL